MSATNSEFLDELSRHGADLFLDPLSELTRKRQSSLLTASVVTILVSLTFIVPIEGSLAGLRFSVTDIDSVILLSGFVTIYFLVVYSIGVIQDLRVHHYRRMSSIGNLTRLANEQKETFLEKGDRMLERTTRIDEIMKGGQPLKDKEHEIRELVEANRQEGETLIPNEAKRLKLLHKTLEAYSRLSKLRLSVEVIFPIVLAFIAIWMSLLS